MQLLDAILAFALTLAALATVVTVIMEASLRMARMRKKNLVEVMKLLNKELGKGSLGISDEERWQFFVRVIHNPAAATAESMATIVKNLPLDQSLAEFGSDKAAGKGVVVRFFGLIRQLFGDSKRAGLYDKVSLEHLLRCLVETESVQRLSREKSKTFKDELNRLAKKYEEFGSAVSVSFRRHSQNWSIGIGIALAIFANIDGLRIFEAYQLDTSLATAVIEQQEAFTNRYEEAQERQNQFAEIEQKVKKAEKKLAEAKAKAKQDKNEIERFEQELAQAKTELEEQASLKKIQQTTQRAQQQIADLVAIGIPLGWDLYPSCPYGGTKEEWAKSSPRCRAIPEDKRKKVPKEDKGTKVSKEDEGKKGFKEGERKKVFKSDWVIASVIKTAMNDPTGFFRWLFSVIITGVLIGLGAPFWFDVAKRLSQIRKGIQSETASSEYRLAGNDANGNPEKRKEIVENVIAEATGMKGRRRAFFDLKGGNYGRIT